MQTTKLDKNIQTTYKTILFNFHSKNHTKRCILDCAEQLKLSIGFLFVLIFVLSKLAKSICETKCNKLIEKHFFTRQ